MYLIHIKDILKNKEFIYDNNAKGDVDFKKCIEYLKDKLEPEQIENLKYTIKDDYAEIYYDYVLQNRGWIWTIDEVRKDVIYILTKISVLQICNKKVETSTQTTNDTSHLTVEVQTPLSLYPSETRISTTQTENLIDSVVETISDENWPFYTTTCIKPMTNYNPGYAKNPFIPQWPDEITTELKEKLTFPNYGLKRNF